MWRFAYVSFRNAYGDSMESEALCRIAERIWVLAVQKNIQICVRVYGKQYDNQLTDFCIVVK
jgi:hypothetical protein